MSKLETLERETKELSVTELESDAWDAQIEADSLAGKLDYLIANALEEEAAGRWKHL